MSTDCPKCGRAIQGLLPLPITFCPSCGHQFNQENEMANFIPAEDLPPQKPWHPSDEIRTITGLAGAGPSPQARRAAEAIADLHGEENILVRRSAEIVERETGVARLLDLRKAVQRFFDTPVNAMPNVWAYHKKLMKEALRQCEATENQQGGR